MTVKRIWRGWTTPEQADAYQRILHKKVKPSIEAKEIDGFRSLELFRRDLELEVEFMTVMTFDSLENIVNLQVEDYQRAYVPDVAQAVLSRWDKVCLHYETVEPGE